jgi:predicted nucleic acid-binding protein
MRSVLVDSSAFLALDDPAERNHPQTVATFQELVRGGARLLTTNFVFDEAYTLLLVRLGRQRAVAWGESLRNSGLVRLERVDEDHEAPAWEIILAFSDKDFTYTNATTSFAVAENLDIPEALSLDRHFHQFGALRVWPPPPPSS